MDNKELEFIIACLTIKTKLLEQYIFEDMMSSEKTEMAENYILNIYKFRRSILKDYNPILNERPEFVKHIDSLFGEEDYD